MANAHIPKHGFSSPSCVGSQLLKCSCQRGELFRFVANWLNACKSSELAVFRLFCCNLNTFLPVNYSLYFRVMSQTKTGLIFLIVITLMRLDILAGNLDCEVNGRIQHTSYNTEGGQDRVQRMNFKLWIREGEWAIRVVPKDELNSSSISEYYECGFDGLNTYRVLLFNTNYNNNSSVQRELRKIQSSLTNTNDSYRKDGDRESSVVVEKLFQNA